MLEQRRTYSRQQLVYLRRGIIILGIRIVYLRNKGGRKITVVNEIKKIIVLSVFTEPGKEMTDKAAIDIASGIGVNSRYVVDFRSLGDIRILFSLKVYKVE